MKLSDLRNSRKPQFLRAAAKVRHEIRDYEIEFFLKTVMKQFVANDYSRELGQEIL